MNEAPLLGITTKEEYGVPDVNGLKANDSSTNLTATQYLPVLVKNEIDTEIDDLVLDQPCNDNDQPVLEEIKIEPEELIQPSLPALYSPKAFSSQKKYKCSVDGCGKSYTRSYSLNCHIRTHSDEKPFECNRCGKHFVLNSYLNLHIKNMHELPHSPYKHKCSVEGCVRVFKRKAILQDHILTHSNKKSFECNHCGKKFGTNHYLKIHIQNLHKCSVEDCDQCKKKFHKPSELARHSREHRELFKCDKCEKSFLGKKYLIIHIKQHENPNAKSKFICEHCGKMYSSKPYLEKHSCKIDKNRFDRKTNLTIER